MKVRVLLLQVFGGDSESECEVLLRLIYGGNKKMTENVLAFALNVFSESVFNYRNLGEGDRVGEHSLCHL